MITLLQRIDISSMPLKKACGILSKKKTIHEITRNDSNQEIFS
jgi:hypothetical protein